MEPLFSAGLCSEWHIQVMRAKMTKSGTHSISDRSDKLLEHLQQKWQAARKNKAQRRPLKARHRQLHLSQGPERVRVRSARSREWGHLVCRKNSPGDLESRHLSALRSKCVVLRQHTRRAEDVGVRVKWLPRPQLCPGTLHLGRSSQDAPCCPHTLPSAVLLFSGTLVRTQEWKR